MEDMQHDLRRAYYLTPESRGDPSKPSISRARSQRGIDACEADPSDRMGRCANCVRLRDERARTLTRSRPQRLDDGAHPACRPFKSRFVPKLQGREDAAERQRARRAKRNHQNPWLSAAIAGDRAARHCGARRQHVDALIARRRSGQPPPGVEPQRRADRRGSCHAAEPGGHHAEDRDGLVRGRGDRGLLGRREQAMNSSQEIGCCAALRLAPALPPACFRRRATRDRRRRQRCPRSE